MTDIGISTGAATRSQQHRSLEQILREQGLRTLPMLWVRELKAETEKKHRPTRKDQLIFGAFMALRWTLWVLSLSMIMVLARRHDQHGRTFHRATTVYLSGMIIALLGTAVYSIGTITILPFVTTVVMFGAGGLAIILELWRSSRNRTAYAFARATSYWMSFRLTENNLPGFMARAPTALRQRATDALQIPGVSVYQEVLDDDPLIYAKKGWGPWAEIVYLGGFETHHFQIDSFDR